MASPKERLAEVRERRPAIDHVLRMQEQYGEAKGSQQAGAVTYFAFLSFFPVLALAFFVVGYVSAVYPDANQNLRTAIDTVLPGLVGGESGIALSDIRSFSGIAGLVGLFGVLYAGLGWVSALRLALTAVFVTPAREVPNFIKGKVRDLVTLVVIGLVLVVAVAVAGFVSGFSTTILEWLGLGTELSWLVKLLAVVLGLAANMALFFSMFKLLAEPHVPTRSLWSGALLGAVGFEMLKQVSGLLLASTKNQPAFQAFGIALILVVWINYFSRVVLYAAAWAWASPEARSLRVAEPADPVQGPATPSFADVEERVSEAAAAHRPWAAPFAAGAGAMLAAVAVLRRRSG